MLSTLKKYFGYSGFRPYQKEVIEKILEKKDCMVVMATGSGKSLCYQVPPLIVEKTAVVISPLISLMQDQVMALKERGIRAEYLGSSQRDLSVQNLAQSGHYQLIFLTPEKACSLPVSFWSKLLEMGICLLAVDEAHCISEWGHDFRVEYKQLDKLRNILLDVPFVGLTATATEKVRTDIMSSLKMHDPYLAIGSFDRKNLFYGVKHFNRGLHFVDELVQEISKSSGNDGSTIIYCTTRKDCEQMFESLQRAGISAGIYHGQMSNKAREECHRSFIRDEVRVMVATVAFGMGIDKPNIRQVIHHGCPKSLEGYYQESGRCGRDGIPSTCWLYYTGSDFVKADFYCGELKTENQRTAVMESLMTAKKYCTTTSCRRKFLLDYFGEKMLSDRCGNCDNCMVSRKELDLSREAFLLMSCIQSCRGKWGVNMPIDVLRGSRAKKILDAHFELLPLHGLGKSYSSKWWKALADQLISHGYLEETIKDVYKFTSVSEQGAQYLSHATADYQPPLFLQLTNEMIDDDEYQHPASGVGTNLATLQAEGFSEAEIKLYDMLLEERMKLARSTGTAPYAVCGDQTIKRIALTRPSSKLRLANIEGVNQHLVTRHGGHLLQAIKDLSKELKLSLDGEAIQPTVTKKVHPLSGHSKKLSPAKYEAWRMWHEDGLSINRIANYQGRAAPIKEGTVCEYLLEAAIEGLEFDWVRFCNEIGLTRNVFSDVQAAIKKVGAKDKLKPIKNELPEDVSYAHIKTVLHMLDCGASLEEMAFGNSSPSANSSPSMADELCKNSTSDNGEKTASTIVTRPEQPKSQSPDNEHSYSPEKRQKLMKIQESSTLLEATEDSLFEWIQSKEEGVSMLDILKHFKGSKEESVIGLLSSLEGDFIIYKKNDLYMLL